MFESYLKDFEKHQDSMKTMKSLAGYDVIIHNALNTVFLEIENPEMIKEIVQPKVMQPKFRKLFSHFIRTFGYGLLFSEKELWKGKKKILTEVFNFILIMGSTPKIIELCNKEFERFEKLSVEQNSCIEKGKFKIDMLELFTGVTSSVICTIFFGDKADREIDGITVDKFLHKLTIDSCRQGL